MEKTQLQQEVKDLILVYMEQKKVSQNKLADLLGVSPATVSNIVNELWERLNEAMLLKIKSFFKSAAWVVIETTNFTIIQDCCKKARKRKLLTGIIGFTGAGKTIALQNYYTNNPNTFMVTCARTMRVKQFLAEILKALGVNYLASDYEMVKQIIEILNKKSNPLLIIDEASKLSPNALMYIQDIWDGIESNAGLVIAGVEYLFDNLKKSADKNKLGMPEFYGRVSSWQYLQEPSKPEIEAICQNNGVSDMAQIKTMYRLGNFRHVRNSILNLVNQ